MRRQRSRQVGTRIGTVLCALLAGAAWAGAANQETGTITGRVLNAHGGGIDNAQLTATSVAGYLSRGTTDEAGNVRMDPLPTGEYNLLIEAPGYRSQRTQVSVRSADRNGIEERLAAMRPSDFTIQVTDDRGRAASRAEITATAPTGWSLEVQAEMDGRATLRDVPPGNWTVSAWRRGQASPSRRIEIDVLRSQQVNLQLERGRAERPGTADAGPGEVHGLRPGAGELVGGVIDSSGAPLPGVTIELEAPDGERRAEYTDRDGRYRFRNIGGGSYGLTMDMPGFSGGEVRNVALTGGRNLLPSVALPLAGFGDLVVVTATRTETRLADAPVPTTVITRDTLETQTAGNLGEMLRTVPGVNVIQLSNRDINVTSRGSTGLATNSQLALVDGRSVYIDFYGGVLWDLVTPNQGDIEQIEVVRGPASATWGANAMTGAVNIITRRPRENPGTTLTMTGGWMDRNAGSSEGAGMGHILGTNVSISRAPTDSLAYRVSAGYYQSDGHPRPTGNVERATDPRIPGRMVGGAPYLELPNPTTRQPKFDVQVEQTLQGGRGRLLYSAGAASSEGTIQTRIGPFRLQRGGYMSYAKVDYERDELEVQFFTNQLRGDAPSLLLPDTNLNYRTQTYDAGITHGSSIGERQNIRYGANLRRNQFQVGIAPTAPDRLEVGAFLQHETDWEHFRTVASARLDKFGEVPTPFLSPRLALSWRPTPDHTVTGAYNRAFRAPAAVEAFMSQHVIPAVDLSWLNALRPLLPALLSPDLPAGHREQAILGLEAQLDQTTAQPFPLRTYAIGGNVPFPHSQEQRGPLLQEAVTAYELSYTGTFPHRMTAGASVYVNDREDNIRLTALPPSADPYTGQNPPPGWTLPGQVLDFLGTQGAYLPRTAFTYANLGPTRQWGIEAWADHRLSLSTSIWGNYSWQARPEVRPSDNPFPLHELNLPPTHRVNVGTTVNGRRFLGSGSVSVSTQAFWSDVLTADYHGYSDGYALVNASFGVRWLDGRVTTMVRATNLLNKSIQQHIFGDILRRTVVGEVRFQLP